MRFLPHSVFATFVVMILPSLAVTMLAPHGPPLLMLLLVLVAMGTSIALASVGSAFWMRRPGSQDLVFGDLMLWGWLRKVRAERRLARARALLGSDDTTSGGAQMLSRERRCEILQQLGALLEARDAYTHGHTRRVTRHSERIAREMGLPVEQVAKVRMAAALHDIGKVHTPREVLTKAGRLTDEEFAVIKRHPVDGAEMVTEIGDPEITLMVRHHHERLDGTGYPDRLSHEEIPLGARIISVADTFDAMTSSRPYRPACKHKKALDVLSREAGSQLDPAAVAAFMRYYSGKRSVAWSALVLTGPQRLASWVGGLFQGAGAGVAPLAQGVIATGAAALVGASLGGSAPPARAVADSGPPHELRKEGAPARAGDDKADESTRGADRRGSSRRSQDGPAERRGGRKRGGSKGPVNNEGTGGGSHPGRADGGSQPGANPEEGTGPRDGAQPHEQPPGSQTGTDEPAPTPEPKDDSPTIEVPIDVPDVEVPGVEVPGVEVPGIEVPTVEVPKIEVPQAELPQL
jgi:putative nucleotidyltransferase with HDIG domain